AFDLSTNFIPEALACRFGLRLVRYRDHAGFGQVLIKALRNRLQREDLPKPLQLVQLALLFEIGSVRLGFFAIVLISGRDLPLQISEPLSDRRNLRLKARENAVETLFNLLFDFLFLSLELDHFRILGAEVFQTESQTLI